MTRNEYIQENKSYLGEDQVGIIEQLTDDQFLAIVNFTKLMGNTDPGLDNTLVKTHETIADFEEARKNNWRECRKYTASTVKNFPAMLYENVQMVKNAPRKSQLAVIDLGDFRIAVS